MIQAQTPKHQNWSEFHRKQKEQISIVGTRRIFLELTVVFP
jgi:hypothetical protein